MLIHLCICPSPMNVPERLVGQSSITPRQLEVLTVYLRAASGEIKMKEAVSLASQGRKRGEPGKPLTIGSFSRTVLQARDNVRESLLTVVIALWVGLVRVEDVRRLFDLVAGGARELSNDEADRFMQLLDALLRRIVV